MRDLLQSMGWRLRLLEDELTIERALASCCATRAVGLAAFLAETSGAVSPDETSWFLISLDYAGASDTAFEWNAWELLSLEAARGDQRWGAKIRAFWASHVPFLLSVRDDYSYLALTVSGPTVGSVVHGTGPEFEEVDVAAPSLDALRAGLPDVLADRCFI